MKNVFSLDVNIDSDIKKMIFDEMDEIKLKLSKISDYLSDYNGLDLTVLKVNSHSEIDEFLKKLEKSESSYYLDIVKKNVFALMEKFNIIDFNLIKGFNIKDKNLKLKLKSQKSAFSRYCYLIQVLMGVSKYTDKYIDK